MKAKSSKKNYKLSVKISKEEEPEFDLPKTDDPYLPRNTTSLDKIRAYYFSKGKKKLSPKLEYLRQTYEFINALLCEGYSRHQTVKFLQGKITTISQGHCYDLINNALELFGDVFKSSKEGQRYMLIENQWKTYRRAVECGDIKEQNSALRNLGLFGALHKGGIEWSKVILPIPVFSSDPEVFKQQQLQETIDISEDDDQEDISES